MSALSSSHVKIPLFFSSISMATTRLVPSLPSSSSIRTPLFFSISLHPSVQFPCPKFSCLLQSHSRQISLPFSSSSPQQWLANKGRSLFTFLAVVDEESVVSEEIDGNQNAIESGGDNLVGRVKKQPRPCELYVCNLPRSHDIPELVEMFKPFGTVLSVEVSRNPENGVSKGCGYVTMGSINAARDAIAALDGSDVGGREMRVKFSVDMSDSRNLVALNSTTTKNLTYESPYKIYIGNISWNTKPENLRDEFSQFGTVVSARVLCDRKRGKNRSYAFLSFTSEAERDAALSLDGKEFQGRILIVRKGFFKDKTEPQ